MRGLLLYSVVVVVAFVLAATGAYVIKLLFIPGFEAWALWLPLTILLFIPLSIFFILRARNARKRTG